MCGADSAHGPQHGADRVPDPGDLRVPAGREQAPRAAERGAGRPGQQGGRLLRQARQPLPRDEVAEETQRSINLLPFPSLFFSCSH